MVRGKFDYDSLKGKDKEEIIGEFLKHIMIDHNIKKAGETGPDLKIMIVENYNLRIEDITKRLEHLYFNEKKEDKKFIKFIDRIEITSDLLSPDVYNLKIKDSHTGKQFNFVVFIENSYWMIFTLATKEDLDKILKRIINSIDRLELIQLSPNHIEDLANSGKFKGSVRGFIAKFSPKYQPEPKNITVNFFGGDLKDLDKLRGLYPIEPTSISFRKRNSPNVEGKFFSEGYFSLQKVNEGAVHIALEAISDLKRSYISINEDTYRKVENFSNILTLGPKGEAMVPKSDFSLVIKFKPERFPPSRYKEDFIELRDLNENIKRYFKNRPQRYFFYQDNDKSYFVLDKLTKNKVQLSFEANHKCIVLYPFRNCKDRTMRDICNGIIEVESSISAIEPFYINY